MEAAFKGMQGSMVPATFISRTVAEGETIAAGAPAQYADAERRQVETADGTKAFLGIHCPVSIEGDAEFPASARIMTQGVVFVEVADDVSEGDQVGFNADGEWGAADSTTYTLRIVGAQYDDTIAAGGLAPIRLMGTEIEEIEELEE